LGNPYLGGRDPGLPLFNYLGFGIFIPTLFGRDFGGFSHFLETFLGLGGEG